MAAVAHLYDAESLEDEIARAERVLANLRGFARRPWNEQQGKKLGWQISACERHLARLERLRGTT